MEIFFENDNLYNSPLFSPEDRGPPTYNAANLYEDYGNYDDNFGSECHKLCDDNNSNINNRLFALPTRETLNEKEIKNKDKVKTNQIKVEETQINYPNEKEKNETKKNGLLGRKRKGDSGSGDHNKFSEDNLRRKCKHLVLDSTFNFINKKIKEKYEGKIGCGRFIRQLLILNQKQKSDASIQFNKDFLNKNLGEIFSEIISSRYTTYHPYHNKYLIKMLTNEQNEDKKNYFTKLFSISFADCLKHFRGSKKIEELEGMNGFDSIKYKFESDADYLKSLEYYIMNYDEIMNKKRTRKANKTEKIVKEP